MVGHSERKILRDEEEMAPQVAPTMKAALPQICFLSLLMLVMSIGFSQQQASILGVTFASEQTTKAPSAHAIVAGNQTSAFSNQTTKGPLGISTATALKSKQTTKAPSAQAIAAEYPTKSYSNQTRNESAITTAATGLENEKTKKESSATAMAAENQTKSFSHQAGKEASIRTTATGLENQTKAFSNLQLFVSCFPGNPDDNDVNGFTEMQSTLIRSLQFFWPASNLRITVALDDTVYNTTDERDGMTKKVKSLFDKDILDLDEQVSVVYNPLSDQTKYGPGYLVQQLIMLWADNFTDSEYIGFVDDDTLFSRAIQPNDLFDTMGRPRVMPLPVDEEMKWTDGNTFSFQREPKLFGMNYFPVIIKRSLLRDMRAFILRTHPQYSYFDEFYLSLIRRNGENINDERNQFSQFYMMIDYAFHNHRDEYRWHIESADPEADGFDPAHAEPFPRVSIHAGYMAFVPRRGGYKFLKNKKVRRQKVSKTLREGYCYSLPRRHRSILDKRRCAKYNMDELYWWGDWHFEREYSPWRNSVTATSKMALAHVEKMNRNEPRWWNDKELKDIFSE